MQSGATGWARITVQPVASTIALTPAEPHIAHKCLPTIRFFVYLCVTLGKSCNQNSGKPLKEMTINEIQDEIIEEFGGFDDWMDRYSYIIELGNAMPALEERHKTADNLIDGCQSRVWIVASLVDGLVVFQADSDALIVRGIISLLLRCLSGQTPQDILDADLYFIGKVGLQEHLSPTRSNGLVSMVKQMRMYALAYKAKGA